MKTTIIKPNGKKDYHLIGPIIVFLLGIILVTNSNSIVTIAFKVIGAFIILFGLYRLLGYFKLKKQFKVDDNDALVSGIMGITIGLIVILLASVLELGLRYIIGFYLVIKGVSKISSALSMKQINKNVFLTYFIEGIILLLLGLYTIIFANAALIIVGIFMIISSVMDFINLFRK